MVVIDYYSYYLCCVYRALVKAAFVLLPVLGSTWVFGLLAINDDTMIFVWIFTVLNSLQVNCITYLATSCFKYCFVVTGSVHYDFICL